ncbi:MAG TPA: SMP-30/gluconolactonase/LRE family protein [Nocardioidaceae bacterium]|nr:SMP-30/gluconolactonase/LRE family protein [Nocardioidaceae bacterium]
MRVVASGFGLVESPRWHDGRLWFSDWTAGEIRRLGDDGSSEVAVRHESLPLCFDFQPDGTMLVVSSAQRKLLRLTGDGELVEHADLEPLSRGGANDIVVDGRGNAYVNSHDAPMGTMAADGEKATGRVYLVPAVGQPRLVADDLDFPNGMAITADNATLIVAESYRHRLTAFAIGPDGDLGERRVFAALPERCPPDGISIDAEGAVWVADVPNQSCFRFAEGGALLEEHVLDRGAFACVLGGQDGNVLYAVGSQWPGMQDLADFRDWDGTVWSTPVTSARAGWPGN